MSRRLGLALLAVVLASAIAGMAYRACGADVDQLLRLEQYRATASGPEVWAKLYPVPPARPPLMAGG